MKVSIIIEGQQNSVNALLRSFSKTARKDYNFYEIECETKAEATKLLSEAAMFLKEEASQYDIEEGSVYMGFE